MMLWGFVLLVGAWLVLFLMTIRQIPPSLPVAMLAYAASVGGLMVGLVGIVQFVRARRPS